MAKPEDVVPQFISIEVNGKAHTVSYVERDGRIEVACEHGRNSGKVHEMPLKANERQKYIESLARLLLSEFHH